MGNIGCCVTTGIDEGVVAKDNAVPELCVYDRARYAKAHKTRIFKNEDVAMELYFGAGCCDMGNIFASFARP